MKRPSNARLEVWVKGRTEPYIIWLPTDPPSDPPVVDQVVFRRYVEQ